MVMGTGQKVAGIEVVENPCPKCGHSMFKKPCPCPFRRKGWATCAKCLNPKCAYTMGLTMRARGSRARAPHRNAGSPFRHI